MSSNINNVVGWKRCFIRYVDGSFEIAGVFASIFGPLKSKQECTCNKSECWCGFSAHRTKTGAFRYRPLDQPIAETIMSDNVRFTGGRKKEYIVSNQQNVTKILWPNWCKETGCTDLGSGLFAHSDGKIEVRCNTHGANISLEKAYSITGVKSLWLSKDYTIWAKAKAV